MTAAVSIHLNTVRAMDRARGRLAADLERFLSAGGQVQQLQPADLSRPVSQAIPAWRGDPRIPHIDDID
ncbi:hypothetical protein BGP89_11245 [Luteimonas sp. JM171]|uniref:hypothetical protein n=1 Tax=Luteimonas sp. JM171 TaxID=1896164 RepID=UPI0008588D5C|nr:hypothetical protein [Luteimonas sp. JM171]AOH36856.1 hypothetical protein BGP89_11245 [Luteimonas sp. JM171]